MPYNIKTIKKEFKEKGIFYTSDEMAKTIKKYVNNDRPKSVYDPTCGDGALLSVFDDDIPKYGQEINAEQLEVAKQRLKNFTGICGDTLKEPAFMERRFDAIVANYPFSISWEQKSDVRFEKAPCLAPKSKADYSFILHILYLLSDSGTAAVLGFPGILYRGNAEAKIRQWLVEKNYIDKIVLFPGDQFVDTKISTVLLVIKKNKKSTDIVFEDYEHKRERVVKVDEIEKNNFNLSVNTYVEIEQTKEEIDPLALDNSARKQFLKKLENELIVQRTMCNIDNNLKPLKGFIKDIKCVIEQFEKSLRNN